MENSLEPLALVLLLGNFCFFFVFKYYLFLILITETKLANIENILKKISVIQKLYVY